MVFVALSQPSGDLPGQGLLVGDTASEALRRQHAKFGFSHIQPASMFWGVVPFEPFGEAARFSGGKGLVERSRRMGAEIVLHQHDLRDVAKVRVRQIPENLCIIQRGVAIGSVRISVCGACSVSPTIMEPLNSAIFCPSTSSQ